MAIYLPLSKFRDSNEAVVAPGIVIQAEGQALVRTSATQSLGVLPSTGGSTEKFAGFAFAGTSAAPFAEGFFNKVEVLVASSSANVTLTQTPVSGQVGVYNVTTGAPIASPTATGKVITGTGISASDTLRVTYKYAVTQIQAVALYGNTQPGGYSGAYVGQIGVVKRGTVYTTEFDASKNWSAATDVKLAANGQLTDQSGSGITIDAQIISLPGVSIPYLGLEFSAP